MKAAWRGEKEGLVKWQFFLLQSKEYEDGESVQAIFFLASAATSTHTTHRYKAGFIFKASFL